MTPIRWISDGTWRGINLEAESLGILLSPALPLTAPVPRSNPVPSSVPRSGPKSGPRSDPSGLALICVAGTTLSGTNLRIAARFVDATVTRVRRHRPPVRALSFYLFSQRGNVVADQRVTLFVLGHCKACKTTH